MFITHQEKEAKLEIMPTFLTYINANFSSNFYKDTGGAEIKLWIDTATDALRVS